MAAEGGEEVKGIGGFLIAIVLFLAVITLFVGLFYYFLSRAENQGNVLSSTMDTAEQSKFNAYDNNIVYGKDITSCAKLYKGQDIVIAVVTKTGAGGNCYVLTSPGLLGTPYYYNALPEGITLSDGKATGDAVEYDSETGMYTIEALSYDEDSGLVLQNTNYAPLTNKSMKETVVRSGCRYYANLVYDKVTGNIAGILFQQLE